MHTDDGNSLMIISGGQTGVDRAALDVAMELGWPHGGWCPLGRLAEDGSIPLQYQLREMSSDQYADRTKQNVIDSGGTLILYWDKLQGGSLMTRRCAELLGRPCLSLRLVRPGNPARVAEWIRSHQIQILNVAGPRASKEPKIYDATVAYLRKLFQYLLATQSKRFQ